MELNLLLILCLSNIVPYFLLIKKKKLKKAKIVDINSIVDNKLISWSMKNFQHQIIEGILLKSFLTKNKNQNLYLFRKS